MSVKIDPGSGYPSVTLPNADQGAVHQLQSSNSGQPQGAAFNQFSNVVSGDQSTMHGLASQINTLESAKPNTLTSAQQAELVSDLQQYESASEKFNSDNAHLVQIAAADNSTPEIQEATTQGVTESVNMQALQNSVAFYTNNNDNIAPSTAAALQTVGASIGDQSNAASFNSAVGGPGAASGDSGSGNGVGNTGAGSPGLVSLSSVSISGQSGFDPFYAPNVDPGAVAAIASSNAGQSTGAAFNQFATVVNADQGALTAIASSLNTLRGDPNAFAGALQQYQQAAAKYTGDQAHLLQIAAADNNAGEVFQATQGGGAQAENMVGIQALATDYAQHESSLKRLPASAAAAISTAASSIGDQAAAVSHNTVTETQAQGLQDIGHNGTTPFYVPTSTVTGGH